MIGRSGMIGRQGRKGGRRTDSGQGRIGKRGGSKRRNTAAGKDKMGLRRLARAIRAGDDIVHARGRSRGESPGREEGRRGRSGLSSDDKVSPADDGQSQHDRDRGPRRRRGPVQGEGIPEEAAGRRRRLAGETRAHARPEGIPITGRKVIRRAGTEQGGKQLRRLLLPPTVGTGSEMRRPGAFRFRREAGFFVALYDRACLAAVHSRFRRLT